METEVIHKNICFAILPIRNLSDNPEMDIFCAGLVMDLITDLSRFRSFHLIAYDAIKALPEVEHAAVQPFQDVQLDYLVKGLLRHHGDRLHFNIQLINARQNRLVWAEKISGALEDIFRIQEEIAEKIVVSLQHFVDADLLAEMRKKPMTSLSAYECWLRGYQELKKGTLESDEQARVYFRNAMDIDPHYARAYTGMSLTYFNEWSCQIWDRWDVSRKGAFEWAQKAVELDEQDHVSIAILGRIHLFNGDYEKAEYLLRKALRLNPNDAENLMLIAFGFVFLGYAEEADHLYQKSWRLNPAAGNNASLACGAFVRFEMGKFEEAIALGEKHELGKGWVDFPAFLAAAYYRKGDLENMQASWALFLREFSEKINQGRPASTHTALQWMKNVNPYRGFTQLQPFWDYLGRGEIASEPASMPRVSDKREENRFSGEAGLWTLDFAGKQVQMAELKGFYDLARLLEQPHTAIHCSALMGALVLEQGEVLLDEKAKKAYQRRIHDLQQEIEEATKFNDTARAASLQDEYDQFLEHLSQSLGKGGRSRTVSGTLEKARTAVTWRIRSAIKKIAEAHPALGRHLEVSVKTGTFCEYNPEHEMGWAVNVPGD